MGEVLRRVDDLVREIKALAEQMRDDRVHAAQTFVRLDVYASDRRGDALAVTEAQKDLAEMQSNAKADANWRRQVMLALAVLAITTLVTVGIAISNYLAR